MEIGYRLIHKSNNTYLPTSLPVYFYGLPDDNIYLIYTRFYEINFSKSGLEFVFAILDNYYYEFESGKITSPDYKPINLSSFASRVETGYFKIKIVKSYRNVKSFKEAQKKLNKKASEMIKNCA